MKDLDLLKILKILAPDYVPAEDSTPTIPQTSADLARALAITATIAYFAEWNDPLLLGRALQNPARPVRTYAEDGLDGVYETAIKEVFAEKLAEATRLLA